MHRVVLLLVVGLLTACSDSSDSNPGDALTLAQVTVDIPSAAKPAHTPGTPGVAVDNPKLLRHFGTSDIDFNNARYTRYFLPDRRDLQPDAVLVLVPGFEGGASNFSVLAENLLRRAREEASLALEVWAVDRRSNQLEDSVGLDIAEDLMDPLVALDFLFGDALGLELSQPLVDGPNRRVVFYNSAEDTAFMAQWTTLVHSQDIDAIVEQARAAASGDNVFLGGHSAGTGFAARYAATDFNLGAGESEPGFQKLRGLVLLEGGGGRLLAEAPDEVTLDTIEARFDGGLYDAIRDQAPRCIDGVTACTSDTAAADCAAFEDTRCSPPIAYAEIPGGSRGQCPRRGRQRRIRALHPAAGPGGR
jgi:pimeloyl-ACP methyl ester carboxylesterase